MTRRKPLGWYPLGGHGTEVPDCGACLEWVTAPGMADAIANVGIETPSGVDVRRMVEQYHANRHQEDV